MRGILFFLVVETFCAVSPALADTCEKKIAEQVCSKEVVDDGTGGVKAFNSDEMIAKVDSALSESLSENKIRFSDYIKSEEGQYLSDQLMDLLPHNKQGPCKHSRKSDYCISVMYQNFSDLFVKRSYLFLLPSSPLSAEKVSFTRYHNISTLPFVESFRFSVEKEVYKTLSVRDLRPIRRLVDQVKKQMIKEIQAFNLDDELKSKMINKIKNITYDENQCGTFSNQVNTAKLNEFFTPNAFYHPQRNSLQICQATLLSVDSEFAMAGLIAHEMSHAIDPCHIESLAKLDPNFKGNRSEKISDSMSPYKNLLACFRDKEKIGAIWSPDLIYDFEGAHNYCGNRDQVVEAFSDWLSVKVVANHMSEKPALKRENYQKGYGNMFRIACHFSEGESPSHLSARARVEKILLQNPTVRKQIGCSKVESGKWCEQSSNVSMPTPQIEEGGTR